MRRTIFILPLLALVACGDTDGDGLANGREDRLGSDPENPDTDGDGMNDGDEVKADTDPVLWDTDGDGYSDFQEIDFGSDPLDVASGVYMGGWPYNPYKDDIEDPGLDGGPVMGEAIARFVAVDQFGEEVDFYDYGGHDKIVMVDVSALWCPPCRQLSSWLAGGTMSGMSSYEPIREAVANGDMLWVTILSEDNNGGPYPDLEEVGWWEERYAVDNVALLADNGDIDLTTSYFNVAFYPSLYLLNDDLELVRGPSSQSWAPAMTSAQNLLEVQYGEE